jgi:Phosphoglycerate dehydrogenase and related dehydrogenases
MVTKALLLEDPHETANETLIEHDIEVTRVPGALDEDELIRALEGVKIVGIRSKTKITRRVIEASPKLRMIGAYCIGTNQIDLEAAKEAGIAVFNAPYANTRSVVELAIAEIISLARMLTVRTESLHDGIWNKSSAHSHEVRGRTLGIIGYGSIGTQLSVLAESLGMNVIFYDIAEKLALGNAKRKDSMEEVLQEADVISIHVDGAKSNANLFGDREFSMMKPGARFINLSRGFIVDIEALRSHLVSGHLRGAAVDVFPTEPKANGDRFDSPLLGLPNVILTPHIGGSTVEAQEAIGRFVSGKLVDYLRFGVTDMSVNLPNLAPAPPSGSKKRMCLVHRNVPGVMGELNMVFAKHKVNVDAQSLATQGEFGYAVTDLAQELPQETIDYIRAMDATIRLRCLTVG